MTTKCKHVKPNFGCLIDLDPYCIGENTRCSDYERRLSKEETFIKKYDLSEIAYVEETNVVVADYPNSARDSENLLKASKGVEVRAIDKNPDDGFIVFILR